MKISMEFRCKMENALQLFFFAGEVYVVQKASSNLSQLSFFLPHPELVVVVVRGRRRRRG